MKMKFKLLYLVILVLISGATYANAEDENFFGRPKSITFKGENENWYVVHHMYLVDTEIEYDTKIRYKGNNEKMKNLPYLNYMITDEIGNPGLGGTFSLNESNEFHSGRTECSGCTYLDKNKEVTFIFGKWEEYDEIVILKRE